ncbi:c-type cytochrome [Halomonas sp. V046]|uniref:c-type cytochrome n=1 Tax=Halomonas sp. V046 TaxID=3459611 RepID=UPI004043D264
MNSSKLIMGCLITLGLATGQAMAQDDADLEAMAKRLEPVGKLCLQGEDCGTAAAASGGEATDSGGGIDGEAIYGSVCMACHDTGAAGAPKHGDEAAWAERTGKGFETLLDHALNGFNAMPARGGNPNLSDEEVHAAVAYLLEPVMDVPAAAGGDAAADSGEETAGDAAAADSGEETTAAAGEATAAADSGEETTAADSGEETTAAAGEESAAADSGEDATAAAGDSATNDDAAAEPAAPAIDGQAIYTSVCFACHDTGVAGAPKRGDAAAWEPRLAQGIETVYDHAINGLNVMPPKGGNPSLSDAEVKAAVDYLVE